VLEVYLWSATAPTTYPTGTSTYTWATGVFTPPSTANSWSLTPGAAVAGQTLWGISVSVSDNLTTATSTATWNSVTAYAVGYAGANGNPALGFIQDSPTPSATFISQTWYKPTSREWYYATATGTGGWQKLLGDMSSLNENTRVGIVAGTGYFSSGIPYPSPGNFVTDYTHDGTTGASDRISIIASYAFTPYWTNSRIQITIFGNVEISDSDDSASYMYSRAFINNVGVGSEHYVGYGYAPSAGPRTFSYNVPVTGYSGSINVQARFRRTGSAGSLPTAQAYIMIEEFLK
jgi:hypothetical protein